MPYYPKDQSLEKLYLVDEFSISEIASFLDTNYSAIRDTLIANGITIRTKSQATTGKLNSNWGGNNVKISSGRDRARRMYPSRSCRICGRETEHHHKDGNPLNNEPSNIDFLCRKHHMEADGRMYRRNNGQFVGVLNAAL